MIQVMIAIGTLCSSPQPGPLKRCQKHYAECVGDLAKYKGDLDAAAEKLRQCVLNKGWWE